jgi:hypothetical protein
MLGATNRYQGPVERRRGLAGGRASGRLVDHAEKQLVGGMKDGKKMEPAGARLALIGAAQNVSITRWLAISLRNLTQQLQIPDLVQLLQLSLGRGGKCGSITQPDCASFDVSCACPRRLFK